MLRVKTERALMHMACGDMVSAWSDLDDAAGEISAEPWFIHRHACVTAAEFLRSPPGASSRILQTCLLEAAERLNGVSVSAAARLPSRLEDVLDMVRGICD